MIPLEFGGVAKFSGLYCCRNDISLTLESDAAELGELFGYSAEEIKTDYHNSILELVNEEARDKLLSKLAEQLSVSDDIEWIFPAFHKNGEMLWVLNRGHRVRRENGQESLYGLLVDITKLKYEYDAEKNEVSELQELAQKDSLTKIYNASITRKLVEEYIDDGKTAKGALLIIDLDDFKQINDQYGHMFGDAILIQVAQTIRKLFRSKDIVGRIGGDEFLVLMKDVSDKEIVRKRCRQLNKGLQEICDGKVSDCKPSCSIGVAFLPDHAESYFNLFCCADRALYHAKDAGRKQYAFYDPQICGGQTDKEALQFVNYDRNVLSGYIEPENSSGC